MGREGDKNTVHRTQNTEHKACPEGSRGDTKSVAPPLLAPRVLCSAYCVLALPCRLGHVAQAARAHLHPATAYLPSLQVYHLTPLGRHVGVAAPVGRHRPPLTDVANFCHTVYRLARPTWAGACLLLWQTRRQPYPVHAD